MCGANAMMVASAALQVGTAVLDYQNKKALAKQKTADNQVAMGHYNEAYLNDLSKIDNESGNASREKAVEEFRITQLKAKDMATAMNAGFGNPFRVMQDIAGATDLDYNYIGFQYNKDMVMLQNQESEAYAHMVKGYSSLTSATQPSLLGTGLQIASAGVNYRTEQLKASDEWKV
tara:strand:+ start:219 stop:743 length:525 start_codon:yes stop_codon:yes gene_type:complete